jgi:hypothetical protein
MEKEAGVLMIMIWAKYMTGCRYCGNKKRNC